MRRREGVYVRPLLGASKRQILAFLADAGIPWREDATNAVADNPRNILRLNALPAMRKAYPGCDAALCRLAEAAARDDAFLEKLTDGYWEKGVRLFPGGAALDIADCPDEAILIRAVRRFAGSEVYSDALLSVPRLCGKEGSRADLGSGVTAAYEKGALFLTRGTPRPDPVPVEVPGETELPGICRMTARYDEARPVRDDPMTQVVDEAALEGAVLRTRRPGDRIAPYGMRGTQSLGDRMTDKKIPLPVRDAIPVVARGSAVIWAVGCGISRDAALREDTRRAVRLQIVMEGDLDAQGR